MKFLALAFLVVVNLIAVPASARDITIQPLDLNASEPP